MSCARVICKKSKFESISNEINTLGWFTVNNMYKYSICVFVYLTLNNLVPDYFTDHVRIKDTPYFTRNPNHICTKEHIPIKSYSSDIISVTSCRLWNNLPNELTN